MAMQGFMRAGASKPELRIQQEHGQMRGGAIRRESKALDSKEIPKTEEKKNEEKPAENIVNPPTDYESMHWQKLKKLATEKGFTGEKFDKTTLINFLQNLPNL